MQCTAQHCPEPFSRSLIYSLITNVICSADTQADDALERLRKRISREIKHGADMEKVGTIACQCEVEAWGRGHSLMVLHCRLLGPYAFNVSLSCLTSLRSILDSNIAYFIISSALLFTSQLFNSMDRDGSGEIDVDEFEAGLDRMGPYLTDALSVLWMSCYSLVNETHIFIHKHAHSLSH